MTFPAHQLWHVGVTITPDGYASRTLSARLQSGRTVADTLRALARQVERECGLRDPLPEMDVEDDENEAHPGRSI